MGERDKDGKRGMRTQMGEGGNRVEQEGGRGMRTG